MSKRTCKNAKNTMRTCRKHHADLSSRNRWFCRKEYADLSKTAASGTCTFQKNRPDVISILHLFGSYPEYPGLSKATQCPHICRKRQLTLPIIVENLSHVCPIASLRCRNLSHDCRQNPRIGRNNFLHLIVCQAVACSDMRLYTIFIPISIFIIYSLCYKLIIRIERVLLCF